MKVKKSLAGAVLLLALSAGGVAVAASMASANAPTPTAPTRSGDAPEIGSVGQPGDKPPAGVTLEKAQPADRRG